MRKANIYYKDILAGVLSETDDGDYIFKNDKAYAWQKIMKELNKKYKGDNLMSFLGEYGILIRE